MDGGVEEPLAAALGVLAVARVLGDVGDQARIEDALTFRTLFSGSMMVFEECPLATCGMIL
jgi:hypothetical protein